MKDLTEYNNWLRLNYSAISAVTYSQKVVTFFNLYPEFNQETINAFFTAHIETWKPKTWNNHLFAFKLYAKYSKVFIEFPKRKRDNNDILPRITEKELWELVDKLPVFLPSALLLKTFLLLLFYGGLRPKEALQIEKKDFDFEKRQIIIRNTKGKTDRLIVIPLKIVKYVKDMVSLNPSNPKVFDFNYKLLMYYFSRINEYMKPKEKLTPYSFRRGFSKYFLNNNKNDMNELATMMGHKDIKTTYVYTKLSAEEAFESVKKRI